MSTRWKWLLLCLAGCVVLLSQAQERPPNASNPPTTLPPPLQLVIMVDDSGTMYDNPYVQQQLFYTGLTRDGSDPQNARWEEIKRLVMMLHTDRLATHQLAILRVGATNEWITGNEDSRFVRLGADGNNQAYAQLLQALTPPTSTGQPDLVDAMGQVQNALIRGQLSDVARVPAILFLTDDVPIQDSAATPFNNRGPWARYAREFESTLRSVVQADPTYQGSYCRHNNGNLMMGIIPIGSANWVFGLNDTRVLSRTDNAVSTPQESYYYQVALGMGFVGYDGQALVYPVDPLLQNEGRLRSDIQNAIDDFINEIRCLDAASLNSPLEFSISALQNQFRVIIEGNPSTVALISPAGRRIAPNPQNLRLITASGLNGLAVARRDFPDDWAGTWQVDLGDTPVNDVRFEADTNLADIRWQARPFSNGERLEVDLLIDEESITVLDQQIIRQVTVYFEGREGSPQRDPITLRPQSDLWLSDPLVFPASGTYNLALSFELAPTIQLDNVQIPGTTYAVLTASGEPIIIRPEVLEQPLRISVVEPANNTLWTCPGGQQSFEVIVEDTGNAERPENTNVFVNMQILYVPQIQPSLEVTEPATQQPNGPSTPTPVATSERVLARLTVQEGGLFTGVINCADLVGTGRQQVRVEASLPGDNTAGEEIGFNFQPTPTPTILAPTPIIPTSEPPIVGSGGRTEPGDPPERISLTWILLFAVLLGGVVTYQGIRYWNANRPLKGVSITLHGYGDSAWRPLLSGLEFWSMVRTKTFTHNDRDLFRFSTDVQGNVEVTILEDGFRIAEQPVNTDLTIRLTAREPVVVLQDAHGQRYTIRDEEINQFEDSE